MTKDPGPQPGDFDDVIDRKDPDDIEYHEGGTPTPGS